MNLDFINSIEFGLITLQLILFYVLLLNCNEFVFFVNEVIQKAVFNWIDFEVAK